MNSLILAMFLLNRFAHSCWSSGGDDPEDEAAKELQIKYMNKYRDRYKYIKYLQKLTWANGVEAEASWPGALCQKGAGTRQSPVDILVPQATRDFEKEFIKYGPLVFRGYDDQQIMFDGFNNGHTLQFISKGKKGVHPTVQGGPLHQEYRLEQIHFHWPSEHAINGQKFPMEVHFVHIRADLDADDALKEWDGLAILAVFWNIQIKRPDRPVMRVNDYRFFAELVVPGSTLKNILLDAGDLLSPNRRSYFSYAGSLSSPECNEAVIWILFEEPLVVAESTYRMFGNLGVQRNNFRSLQPLSEHRVFRTPYRAFMTPLVQDTFRDFTKIVKQEVKNISKLAWDWSGRVAKAAHYTFYKFNPFKEKAEIANNTSITKPEGEDKDQLKENDKGGDDYESESVKDKTGGNNKTKVKENEEDKERIGEEKDVTNNQENEKTKEKESKDKEKSKLREEDKDESGETIHKFTEKDEDESKEANDAPKEEDKYKTASKDKNKTEKKENEGIEENIQEEPMGKENNDLKEKEKEVTEEKEIDDSGEKEKGESEAKDKDEYAAVKDESGKDDDESEEVKDASEKDKDNITGKGKDGTIEKDEEVTKEKKNEEPEGKEKGESDEKDKAENNVKEENKDQIKEHNVTEKYGDKDKIEDTNNGKIVANNKDEYQAEVKRNSKEVSEDNDKHKIDEDKSEGNGKDDPKKEVESEVKNKDISKETGAIDQEKYKINSTNEGKHEKEIKGDNKENFKANAKEKYENKVNEAQYDDFTNEYNDEVIDEDRDIAKEEDESSVKKEDTVKNYMEVANEKGVKEVIKYRNKEENADNNDNKEGDDSFKGYKKENAKENEKYDAKGQEHIDGDNNNEIVFDQLRKHYVDKAYGNEADDPGGNKAFNDVENDEDNLNLNNAELYRNPFEDYRNKAIVENKRRNSLQKFNQVNGTRINAIINKFLNEHKRKHINNIRPTISIPGRRMHKSFFDSYREN